MKIVCALVIIAYINNAWSANVNCGLQIQQYHQCEQQANSVRESGRNQGGNDQRIDQCFINNDCQVPIENNQLNGDANQQKKHQCQREIHDKLQLSVRNCLRQANVLVDVSPQQNQHGSREKWGKRRGSHKKEIERACANAQDKVRAVQACIKQGSANQNNDQQQRDNFNRYCQTKQSCSSSLNANCKAQLDSQRNAICQCRKQQYTDANRNQVKGQIPACQGVVLDEHRRDQDQCDQQKDYCIQGGYDAWKADRHRFGQ